MHHISEGDKNFNKHSTHKYVCPECKYDYHVLLRYGKFIDRVPLVLNCFHSMCETCVSQQAYCFKIVCATCKQVSSIPQDQALEIQDVFVPNYYLVGMLLHKKGPNKRNPGKLTETSMSLKYRPSLNSENDQKPTDSGSALKNTTFNLEPCLIHSGMKKEMYCNVCSNDVCVYCYTDEHIGHDAVKLNVLTKEHMDSLPEYQQKAEKILRHLREAEKKLKLTNEGKDVVESRIRNYIGDLHARLYFIENNLIKQLNSDSNRSSAVQDFTNKIRTSVDLIEGYLGVISILETRKFNIKNLFDGLKKMDEVPCYLENLPTNIWDAQDVIIDPLDDLESKFKLKQSPDVNLTLLPITDIPDDYQEPEDSSSTRSSSVDFSKERRKPKNKRNSPYYKYPPKSNQYKWTNSLDKVMITHVDSLYNFFVLQNKFRKAYIGLEEDIQRYTSMNNKCGIVTNPVLNEIYLVSWKQPGQIVWLRGRVTNISRKPNVDMCDIFFIDRGNSQTVNIRRLRTISSELAERRPYIIQCQLYERQSMNWSSDAHIYFSKIINQKDVYMQIVNCHNNIYEVDILISSPTGQMTSVQDLLINTCSSLVSSGEDAASIDLSFPMRASTHTSMKVYPNSVKFSLNQKVHVMIAAVENPSKIFVHEVANFETIKLFQENMDSYYKNCKSVCSIVEGIYIAVRYMDLIRGVWHRALVKTVNQDNDTMVVFLVDWGVELTLETNKGRPLKESFARLECQAIEIKLADIDPLDLTAWSTDSTKYLQKYFLQRDALKMFVVSVKPLKVLLFKESENADICINAEMVQKNFAKATGKASLITDWPQNSEPDPNIEETDLIENIVKIIENDEDEEQMSGLPQSIVISRFVNPSLIYIKFKTHQSKIEELFKELQVLYHNPSERHVQDKWEINDKCVVFSKKGYCRGIIKECLPDNNYNILLIDSGFDEVVSAEKIYVFNNYFKKYHNMAQKAFLSGVYPAGDSGNWSTGAVETLVQVFNKYPDIFVTKDGPLSENKMLPVKMWYKYVKVSKVDGLEPLYCKYVSINDLLVKMGLASQKCLSINQNNIEKNGSEEETLVNLVDTFKKLKTKESTKNGELHIQEWPKPLKIKKNKFSAWITCVCQKTGLIYLRDEETQTAYGHMQNKLKNYFEENPPSHKNSEWETDQLCTIHYEGMWYRGTIVEKKSSNDIEVYMIDFGSYHFVKTTDLYIQILYPDIPTFVNKARLCNVEMKCGKWLLDDQDAVMNTIEENVLVIVNGSTSDDILEIDIYLSSGELLNRKVTEMSENLMYTGGTELEEMEKNMIDLACTNLEHEDDGCNLVL